MRKVVDLYFSLLKLIIAFCMIAMVALVFTNVVLRYAFNSSISVSEELSRWFFVWMVFTGSLILLKERAHLGVDTLVKQFPAIGRRICLFISYLAMLYITWLITSGSWVQMQINMSVTAPASGLSMGWFYGTGVFFGVTAGLILLVDLLLVMTGKLGGEPQHGLIPEDVSEEQLNKGNHARRAH
ncbi:C4-dicarboxylate ABC transporter permease [Pokkaliibacter plantistimulans]|uniref:TRAP transporter small permease protein n=1 Tax=Pokkaliibacter plantistimulans TaxID=1635171 RepID=A0ABX5M039_9GAMM|nr:TRAP transporter small permease [Pokkaliibacter plantistimulans]PXF31088.1 C4-dicarboxylate ABC transporter permease [Pokkaliibacter plantistimulans]